MIALRLLPKLAESGSTSQPSRLVITASDTHSWIAALPKTGVLRALDSKERSNAAGKSADKGEQALAAMSRYPVSKLCEVLLVQEMARHIPSSVVVTTTNPGLCNSELSRNAEGAMGYVLYVMKCVLARPIDTHELGLCSRARQSRAVAASSRRRCSPSQRSPEATGRPARHTRALLGQRVG